MTDVSTTPATVATPEPPDMALEYDIRRLDEDPRTVEPARLVSVTFRQNGVMIYGDIHRIDAIALADALYEAAGDGFMRQPIEKPGTKTIPGVLDEKGRRLAKRK